MELDEATLSVIVGIAFSIGLTVADKYVKGVVLTALQKRVTIAVLCVLAGVATLAVRGGGSATIFEFVMKLLPNVAWAFLGSQAAFVFTPKQAEKNETAPN